MDGWMDGWIRRYGGLFQGLARALQVRVPDCVQHTYHCACACAWAFADRHQPREQSSVDSWRLWWCFCSMRLSPNAAASSVNCLIAVSPSTPIERVPAVFPPEFKEGQATHRQGFSSLITQPRWETPPPAFLPIEAIGRWLPI